MEAKPEGALLHERAESHFGGVVGDPRSCKIFGKAVITLTAEEILVKGSGHTFAWRCVPHPHLVFASPPPIRKKMGEAVRTARRSQSRLRALPARRLNKLAVCKKSATFDHGEFVIDETSKLGQLLELQGVCKQPPAEAKGDAAKMMHVGNVHFAIRGLADTDAWVSKIKELQRQLPQS